MGTKYWVRGFGGQSFTNGQAGSVVDPFILAFTLAENAGDTLVRAVVDVGLMMDFDDSNEPTGLGMWWASACPYICAGRGVYPGDTPLEGTFTGDERITGTQLLGLTSIYQNTHASTRHVAKWETRQILDARGQRKPIGGGEVPSCQVTGAVTSVWPWFPNNSGAVWRVGWGVWIRSLWETP